MPLSRKSCGLAGREHALQMTEFGRQLLRFARSWRIFTVGVATAVVGLAIQAFVEGHQGRGAAYLGIAAATLVVAALAAAFDWSWISFWLYRVSLPLNVALVLWLGNIADAKRVAIAVGLFVSAFLAGLYAGHSESD